MTVEIFENSVHLVIAPSLRAVIEPDPLGPVNKIVSLVRTDHDGKRTKIRSALCPIRAGTVVQLGRGVMERDGGDQIPWALPFGIPCWYISVDGRRVMQVFDSEVFPPPPRPGPPWYLRARRAAATRWRAIADAGARKLGYVRIGHCDCGDDF